MFNQNSDPVAAKTLKEPSGFNALRYLARTGCSWRLLPKDFPRWQTVYWWFRHLLRRLLFQTVQDVTLMIDRERAGREAGPSAGVVDSQSVKAPAARERGYDAGKKINGRKRHIVVASVGFREALS
ncbi:transposase [Azospirillum lipoferum]|nr:transposase [Azospirillum lipoferum]